MFENTDFKLKSNTNASKQLYLSVLAINDVSTLKLYGEPFLPSQSPSFEFVLLRKECLLEVQDFDLGFKIQV